MMFIWAWKVMNVMKVVVKTAVTMLSAAPLAMVMMLVGGHLGSRH